MTAWRKHTDALFQVTDSLFCSLWLSKKLQAGPNKLFSRLTVSKSILCFLYFYHIVECAMKHCLHIIDMIDESTHFRIRLSWLELKPNFHSNHLCGFGHVF